MGIVHIKPCEINNPNEHAHERASLCTITQTSAGQELTSVCSCCTRDSSYFGTTSVFWAHKQYGPRVKTQKWCRGQQKMYVEGPVTAYFRFHFNCFVAKCCLISQWVSDQKTRDVFPVRFRKCLDTLLAAVKGQLRNQQRKRNKKGRSTGELMRPNA